MIGEAYRPFAIPAATTAGLTVNRSKERYGRGGSERLLLPCELNA